MPATSADGNTAQAASRRNAVACATSFTDEVLDDAMAAILRTKTPAERLAIGFRLWTFAQQMLRETLRRDHPDWEEAEIGRHVARRMSHGAIKKLDVENEWQLVLSRQRRFTKSNPNSRKSHRQTSLRTIPSCFLIRDNHSGAILFLGRLVDPRQN